MGDDDRASKRANLGLVNEVGPAVALLAELSAQPEADEWVSVCRWGVRVTATEETLRRIASSSHLDVVVEPQETPLPGGAPPFSLGRLSEHDLRDLAAATAVSAAEHRAIEGMESGEDLALWLLGAGSRLKLVVELSPPWQFWMRSTDDCDALLADWVASAYAAASAPSIVVARPVQQSWELQRWDPPRPSSTGSPELPPVVRVASRDAPDAVAHPMAKVADLVCWLHLATTATRTSSGYSIALHEHQAQFPLSFVELTSSPEPLLRWATSSPDPLRGEALRHTLRSMSEPLLPNPASVMKSAAQYLILFSQTRSAEVLRARDTTLAAVKAAVRDVRRSTEESIRDSLRDSLAAILSSVGLVAAASRLGPAATEIGAWLIAGIALILMPSTAFGRLQRTRNSIAELRAEALEASTNPFLTAEDRTLVQRQAALDTVESMASRARLFVIAVAFTATAATIALALLGLRATEAPLQQPAPSATPRALSMGQP